MTGGRILLRRAQSTARRARKFAAVQNIPLEEDWTHIQDTCPLPHFGYSKKDKTLGILKFQGDDVIREYFDKNPKMARVPIDLRNNRLIPIKARVLLEQDQDAHDKNYPFIRKEDLDQELLLDQELGKKSK